MPSPPSLLSLLSSTNPSNPPLTLIAHSPALSAHFLLRHALREALRAGQAPVLLCLEQAPGYFLRGLSAEEREQVRVVDGRGWEGYGEAQEGRGWKERVEELIGASPNAPPSIFIDSLTLLSTLTSSTTLLSSLSTLLSTPSLRLTALYLLPSPLTPHLLFPTLSSSLTHLTLHAPVLLRHIATAYRLAPSSPRFLEILHEEAALAQVGSRNAGEAIVEVLVRRSGGAGAKTGVQVGLEGVRVGRGGVVEGVSLKELGLEEKEGGVSQVARHEPDPTALPGISFNLSLTPEQRSAREAVPLPYIQQQAQQADGQPLQQQQQPLAPVIIYDPDSADDMDDEDPDEDLDL